MMEPGHYKTAAQKGLVKKLFFFVLKFGDISGKTKQLMEQSPEGKVLKKHAGMPNNSTPTQKALVQWRWLDKRNGRGRDIFNWYKTEALYKKSPAGKIFNASIIFRKFQEKSALTYVPIAEGEPRYFGSFGLRGCSESQNNLMQVYVQPKGPGQNWTVSTNEILRMQIMKEHRWD